SCGPRRNRLGDGGRRRSCRGSRRVAGARFRGASRPGDLRRRGGAPGRRRNRRGVRAGAARCPRRSDDYAPRRITTRYDGAVKSALAAAGIIVGAAGLAHLDARAPLVGGIEYLVYVASEAADKISLVRFGAEGGRLD